MAFNGCVFCVEDGKIVGIMKGLWHDADEDVDSVEKEEDGYEINEPAAFEIDGDVFGTVSERFAGGTIYEGLTGYGIFDPSCVVPEGRKSIIFILGEDKTHSYFVLD